ncbi:MAG: Fic family protein [Fimbriimonadaceae bacterium]|nr:Fic family protein [Fimbriimonadaceae bacterium]
MMEAHSAIRTPLDRSSPHNSLPPLPPAIEIETKRTLKKAIGANKALAELKMAGHLIPNQSVLLRAIVLQEAKLSSEIENVFTTNDELYRALGEDVEKTDPATKEVLRYQEALWHGFKHLQNGGRVTVELFLDVVNLIKQSSMTVRSHTGTKIVNNRTGEVVYSPPEGQGLLLDLLQNLSDYWNQDDGVDPLIKMAVMHYQFEAIHPFSDGNGRAGRVLNILLLCDKGLLDTPILYLSQFIIRNKSAYYDGLLAVTEQDGWEDWILLMLEGIEATAQDTRQRVTKIHGLIEEAMDHARREMQKGYSKELIELIFSQVYTRISDLEEQGIAKRDAASYYLKELVRIGLLRSLKHGREVLYINQRLLEILSA